MTVELATRESVLASLGKQASKAVSAQKLMEEMARQLSQIPGYDWVGFYLISNSDPEILELGPFVGAPTPHVRIPLNQGICGAAAASEKTIVVDDVRSDPRYLACSLDTKSEIVAPIFKHGKVVGELDIDSHSPAAFGHEDKVFVEECAALVGRAMEAAGNDR